VITYEIPAQYSDSLDVSFKHIVMSFDNINNQDIFGIQQLQGESQSLQQGYDGNDIEMLQSVSSQTSSFVSSTRTS